MKKTYVLTQKEVGDYLVHQIGIFKEGTGFFPYKIIKTNMKVPKTVKIELEYSPKGENIEHNFGDNNNEMD